MVKAKDESDLIKATLHNKVLLADGVTTEKRSVELFMAHDSDVETLLRLMFDFEIATNNSNLALSDAKKFIEFRKCTNFIVRDKYDAALLDRPGRDNVSFGLIMNDLISAFCPNTSCADQKRYVDNFQKPFRMTVMDCCNRLETANRLSSKLPGSGGVTCYSTEARHPQLKIAFFNMMPRAWKLKFASSTNNINERDYEMENLRDFMITQQSLSDTNYLGSNNNNFGSNNQSFANNRTRDSPQRYNNYSNRRTLGGFGSPFRSSHRSPNRYTPYGNRGSRPQPSASGFNTPRGNRSPRVNFSRSTPRPANRNLPAPPSQGRANRSPGTNMRSPPPIRRQPQGAFHSNRSHPRRDNFFAPNNSNQDFRDDSHFPNLAPDQYFAGEEFNYDLDNNYGGQESDAQYDDNYYQDGDNYDNGGENGYENDICDNECAQMGQPEGDY